MLRRAVTTTALVPASSFPRITSSRCAGAESSTSSVRRSFSPAVMSMAGYIAPENMKITTM